MKITKYSVEIFEPGSFDTPWVVFSSPTPFMKISVGEIVNPSVWPGSQSPMKVLRVVGVEHVLHEVGGNAKHHINAYTEEVEGSRKMRVAGTPKAEARLSLPEHPKVEEAYNQLRSWTKSLQRTIEAVSSEFQGTLNGDVALLSNAPSRESQALLVLGQVSKKLSEVNGAHNYIRDLLLETSRADQDFSDSGPAA